MTLPYTRCARGAEMTRRAFCILYTALAVKKNTVNNIFLPPRAAHRWWVQDWATNIHSFSRALASRCRFVTYSFGCGCCYVLANIHNPSAGTACLRPSLAIHISPILVLPSHTSFEWPIDETSVDSAKLPASIAQFYIACSIKTDVFVHEHSAPSYGLWNVT